MATINNNIGSTQMSTPLDSLPLKTNQIQDANIDDPMIQNVLNEFEDEYNNNKKDDMIMPPPSFPTQQSSFPIQQQDYNMYNNINTNMNNLEFNKNKKELFDIDLIKKGIIFTIFIIIIQEKNIIPLMSKYLPEYLLTYLNGREFFVYFLIVFVVLYLFMYYDLI